MLFDTAMDDGGRLVQDIAGNVIDPAAQYELVFATGAYWQARDIARSGAADNGRGRGAVCHDRRCGTLSYTGDPFTEFILNLVVRRVNG